MYDGGGVTTKLYLEGLKHDFYDTKLLIERSIPFLGLSGLHEKNEYFSNVSYVTVIVLLSFTISSVSKAFCYFRLVICPSASPSS